MVGVILASRRSSIRTSVLATDNSFHDKVGGKRLQHDLNASANYFLPEDLRLGGEDLLTEQHAWCMIRLDTTRSSFYDIMDPLDEGDLVQRNLLAYLGGRHALQTMVFIPIVEVAYVLDPLVAIPWKAHSGQNGWLGGPTCS